MGGAKTGTTQSNKELGRKAVIRLAQVSSATGVADETDSRGDAVFPRSGKADAYLEVKGFAKLQGAQLNQVRALAYVVLVAWHEASDAFYVFPPNDVLAILCRKARGQHGGLAVENGVIHISKLVTSKYKLPDHKLDKAVEAAIIEGEQAWQDVEADVNRLRTAIDDLKTLPGNVWPQARMTREELEGFAARSRL